MRPWQNTTNQWSFPAPPITTGENRKPRQLFSGAFPPPPLGRAGYMEENYNKPLHSGLPRLLCCKVNAKSFLRSSLCFNTLCKIGMQNRMQIDANGMQNRCKRTRAGFTPIPAARRFRVGFARPARIQPPASNTLKSLSDGRFLRFRRPSD